MCSHALLYILCYSIICLELFGSITQCAQSASAANMMMELVKDNLKIICMIKKEHIKNFVKIMKRKKVR